MKPVNKYKFLIAAGGTGGHLFPGVAVAENIRLLKPEADILFIGSKNRIEERVIPQLGYKFKTLWVQALTRKINLKNLLFPVKLIVSLIQAFYINIRFKPGVAIGTGGFVSGPAVAAAALTGSKVMLLEQNNHPGLTTRMLDMLADEIHISFKETEKYLKNKNIYVTGNPVRASLKKISRTDAVKSFSLNPEKKVILALGGSLGAASINEAIAFGIRVFEGKNIQVIWQTGKNYFKLFTSCASNNVFVTEFINDMNTAYSACDLLISRAGATTIAELLVLGIPSVLIPSPNVANNHQYFNAKYLSDNNAAVLLNDDEAKTRVAELVVSLIADETRLTEMSSNALKMAKPEAAGVIAGRALKFVES